MRVAVIIPVWNEAGAIGRLLAELPPGVADEVFVVDGGSADGTQAVARAAGATLPGAGGARLRRRLPHGRAGGDRRGACLPRR
ncbi:MAG: glycosyltransferase [Dehalococcoidia bacterium]